jgi:hypothetical protein
MNHDALLYWLLTRYAVHSDYYLDGVWLAAFLERCVERWKYFMFTDNDRMHLFYDEIDEPETIFKKIAADVCRFPPQRTVPGSWSRDRLQCQVALYDKLISYLIKKLDENKVKYDLKEI